MTNPGGSQPDRKCAVACMCVATVAVQQLQGPVAEMRGYLEALVRSDDAAGGRLAEAARQAGDRMRDVVESLTAYVDVDQAADRRPIDLGSVITTAAAMVADELSARRIRLRVDPLPDLTADPRQLYRAAVVLLRMVARAGVPDSVLTVQAQRCDLEWRVRIGLEPPLSGISPAGGSSGAVASDGVELLTAQRVVEAHGGRLWLSAGNGPPTVWFTIPDGPEVRP